MKYIFFILTIFFSLILCIFLLGWILSMKKYPAEWGVSFDPDHARSLGLDWKKVYVATLTELRPSHIRIATKWSQIESTRGIYFFEDMDWMLDEAAKHGTRVTLAIGQKVPRWPECHIPSWAEGSLQIHEPEFMAFVEAVVGRYKTHSSLDLWQVENEPFITFKFGECAEYDPSIIYRELPLVQKLDPEHKIMTTDSGELNIWWRATRIGDVFGTTIYRNVRIPTGHTFTYSWLPPGLYKMRARLLQRPYEKFYVSELQAEPWFTTGGPLDTSVAIQEETMSARTLEKNIDYAERVGASRIYLWGVEWWYYMKEVRGDARYWDLISENFKQNG